MNQKIILGTVQLGLNYGINNSNGKPSEQKAFEILDTAYGNGINSLDTADAYGDSITLIGNYHKNRNIRFRILSKFKNVGKGQLLLTAKNALDKLGISEFEVYSYHSFNDYLSNDNVINELLDLKSKGLVGKTGISVYTNDELEKVIKDSNIDVIQIPFNLLDNINLRGFLIDKAKQHGKEIHVRSVFLQGLFFMDLDRFPAKLTLLKPYIQKIKDYCITESLSIQSLALSYVLFNKSIDNALIGVETSSQLLMNLKSIQNIHNAFDFINSSVFVKETDLLNPVNWT